MALDKDESKLLAKAVSDVQTFYNFETSQEIMIWTNLVGVCGMIYGPRVMVMMKRKKSSKESKAPIESVSSSNTSNDSPAFVEGVTIPHHAPTE